MKYSLTRRQPASKAARVARSRSSSVTFLLMMSRMRWLPASGAKVRPPFFSPATAAAMSTKAARVARSRSSSVTFLLMMSRMRWLPASGAKVRPPFFSPATAAAMSTPMESRR